MADQTTTVTDQDSLQTALSQLALGVKETSDALRANSEVGTLLANVLSTTMDEKTRNRVLDIATDPRLSRRDRRIATRDAMATHISKLANSFKGFTATNSYLAKNNGLLQKLVTTVEALHSSVSSVAKKTTSQAPSVQTSSGSQKKSLYQQRRRREAEEDRRINYAARKINRNFARNPLLRTLLPNSVARYARGFAATSDSMRLLGRGLRARGHTTTGNFLVNSGKSLGRLAGGAAGASFGAMAAVGGIAVLAAIAVMVAKRAMASYSSVLKMQGRTGDNRYNLWGQTLLEFKAGTWGYSQKDVAKKQMEFAKAGFTETTDTGILESGLRSEKYFGVDNTAQYFQTLRRSTDAIRRYGSDLGKEFFSLRTIVRNTGMGLEELQQHQTGFMESFKGATTPFQLGQLDALMSNFKDLLTSKETTGTELASFYNANQRVDTNTMLTSAWFAERGGYKFRNKNGDLLDKAFELRHMGSGDLAGRARAFQAELKGIYNQFGVSKFSQLSGSQKFIVTEQLMPQLLGIDASKLPSIDTFMSRFDRGAGITGIDKDTEDQIKKAQETDTDRIVQKMSLLENPLNTIANIIMRWATFNVLGARSYVKDAERKASEEKGKQTVPDFAVSVYNLTDEKLAVKKGKPGQKAQIVEKIQGGIK